jgi:hypothetical protein
MGDDPPDHPFDYANVCYRVWEDEVVIVVWGSYLAEASGGGSVGDHFEAHVYFLYDTDPDRPGQQVESTKRIELYCEAERGQPGTVTIQEKAHSLADGRLFLVSGAPDHLRVKQLRRDVGNLKFERDSLIAFGKGDPEIVAFFAEIGKQK